MSTGLEYLLSTFEEEQPTAVAAPLPFPYPYPCLNRSTLAPSWIAAPSADPHPLSALASLSGRAQLEVLERIARQQRNLNGGGSGVASAGGFDPPEDRPRGRPVPAPPRISAAGSLGSALGAALAGSALANSASDRTGDPLAPYRARPLFPPEDLRSVQSRLQEELCRRMAEAARQREAADARSTSEGREVGDDWANYMSEGDGESYATVDFESEGEESGEESGSEESGREEARGAGRTAADAPTAAFGTNDSPTGSPGSEELARAEERPPPSLDAPAPEAAEASPEPPTGPPPRARRQAAIHCLDRISTALSTNGMGRSFDEEDMTLRELEDRKPPARAGRKRGDKRTESALSGKKRRAEGKPKEEEEEPSPCCICLDVPTPEDLASISGCSHPFCFGCIEKWAERENTCPLCKARFAEIKRVNEGRGENSKRVCNRDQRADFTLMNPLNGMFASAASANAEPQGTWPTHIAQLLFSGLGASSVNGTATAAAARRASDVNEAAAAARRAAEAAAARVAAPPRVGFSARSHPTYAHALGARAPSAAAEREPFSVFLERINSHRQHQQQLQRIREIGEGLASTQVAAGAGPSSSSLNPFSPFATTTRRTTTTTTTESTPWGASRSSIHVQIGPAFGSASQLGGAPSASPLAFSPFGSPSATAPSASAPAGEASLLGNPFASINITRREEEEEILSTISPSSYIRRLHREMERTAGSYRYSAVASRTSESTRPASRAQPPRSLSELLSGAGGGIDYAAGRSAETALEIDDSDDDDDDVVEVLAVEAMM